MRQGVICMLIAALVLQLAGGVVAGGAEPLAMTTQETIRTVAVSGVPTALMRGGQTPGAYAVVPYGRGLPSGGQLAELVRHGVVLVSGR